MGFQEVTTPQEFESAFELVKELRPHLDYDRFIDLFLQAKKDNSYTLVAEFEGERAIGVMGYRYLSDYVHGRHLYIDDLIVREDKRGSGLGAAFLKYAERRARENGCSGLRLCTGIENEGGIRFYQREGWELRAHAFKKRLR